MLHQCILTAVAPGSRWDYRTVTLDDLHSKLHGKTMTSLSEMSSEDTSDYRMTLESVIREKKKIQEQEAQTREMGIDVSVLKAK